MVFMLHIAMAKRTLPKIKTIALVAHDSCKKFLLDWVRTQQDKLTQFNLIATGTTGEEVEHTLKHPVQRLLSGPYGGDQQLGSLIAEGKVHMIFFFWDALEQQPHDNDVKALQRLAVLWNIPMACNRASADFMIDTPFLTQEYETEVPDVS